MRLFLVMAVCFWMTATSLGQVGGGGYSIVEINNDRLNPLKYSESADAPDGALWIKGHEANFSFKIQRTGNPLPPQPYKWEWSVARDLIPPGSMVPVDAVIVDGNGSLPTAVGRVYYPGEYIVRCIITVSTSSGDVGYNLSLRVAAFGGPLRFQQYASVLHRVGQDPSPVQSPASLNWLPGGNPKDKEPRYCQYFGTAPNGPYADYEQQPSWYAVTTFGQPGSCTYQWTTPSFLTNLSPFVEFRLLMANSAGPSSKVAVHYVVTWVAPDDNSTWNDEADDTTEQEAENSSKVTARMPGNLVVAFTTPGIHTGGIPGKRAAKRHDVMRLFDTFGTSMPGVLLTERFTTSLPPGGASNLDGEGWFARFGTGANVSYSLHAPGWPDNGQSLTHAISDGCLGTYDNLRYIWLGSDATTYNIVHQYWAGSLDVDIGGVGVNVGAWTIDLIPAAIGARGTVNHHP
ncbi:MAG TPA: hypothetical protein PKA27_08380 [Fimbriimonadaceae bacterium]|nr:hypothetical protein [Fimbriimonadaceae bacterium]